MWVQKREKALGTRHTDTAKQMETVSPALWSLKVFKILFGGLKMRYHFILLLKANLNI